MGAGVNRVRGSRPVRAHGRRRRRDRDAVGAVGFRGSRPAPSGAVRAAWGRVRGWRVAKRGRCGRNGVHGRRHGPRGRRESVFE